MSKQTAVEWFYQRILAKDIKEVFEQAKQMEKEQITEAYNESFRLRHKPYSTADKYYNETYGGQDEN